MFVRGALILGLLIFLIVLSGSTEFRFKTPIFITNPEASPLVDTEVSVMVDTSELVYRLKMDASCGDVRFRYNNASVTYWLESGCFTPYTTFWLLIPSIGASETIEVEMLYGANLQSGSEVFRSRLMVPFAEPCETVHSGFEAYPDGLWSEYVAGVSETRYFRGGSTLSKGGSFSHTHRSSASRLSNVDSRDIRSPPVRSPWSSLAWIASTSHYHQSFLTYTDSYSIHPGYFLNTMCVTYRLHFPAGSVIMFDRPESDPLRQDTRIVGDVSSVWEVPYVKSLDRFLRLAPGIVADLVGGSPVLPAEDYSGHSHNFDHYYMYTYGYAPCEDQVSYFVSYENHVHRTWVTCPPSASRQSMLPPYTGVMYAKAKTDAYPLPGMIIVSEDLPPLGWERVSWGGYDYPVGVNGSADPSLMGSTGGGSSHKHPCTYGTPEVATQFQWYVWCLYDPPYYDFLWVNYDHRHTIVDPPDFGVYSGTNHPMYHSYPLIRRKQTLPSTLGDEVTLEILCGGFKHTDKRACSERGNCIAYENCACVWPFYGFNCVEEIRDAEFVEKDIMTMKFVVPLDVLANHDMTEEKGTDDEDGKLVYRMDCDRIFDDLSIEKLGSIDHFQDNLTSVRCFWVVSGLFSRELKVVVSGDSPIVVSGYDVLSYPTALTVVPLSLPIEGSELVVNVKPWIAPVPFLQSTGFFGMVSGLGVIFVIIVIIFVVLGILGIYYCARLRKQKARLSVLNEIEDVDILIQERMLEKNTGMQHLTINKELFKVDMDEIELVSEIGAGGGGAKVFLANWKGQQVALKLFNAHNMTGGFFEEFEKEVSILASVNHPHVLSFYGATLREPRIGFIMEYCSNGDLDIFLTRFKEETDRNGYPLEEKIRMMHEISLAMSYLHSMSIIHRDMKCQNVLVTHEFETRVMDFGLSRAITQTKTMAKMTQRVGTSCYMAPEVLLGANYTTKCDVFSFGIMLWEIRMDDFNPYGDETVGIEFQVANDPTKRPDISSMVYDTHNWLPTLMVQCWSHSPDDRPSFDEIVDVLCKRKPKEGWGVKGFSGPLKKAGDIISWKDVERLRQTLADLKKGFEQDLGKKRDEIAEIRGQIDEV